MYSIKELGLTLDIGMDLTGKLIDIGKKHYPNEFGGFLIGYYSESQTHLIITDSILPNKYKATPYIFERDAIGVETQLQQFYREEPKKYYVGEWHTHPNNLAVPSAVDITALCSIADDPEVSIKNPTLLIIGHADDEIELGFYFYFKNKIYRYEQ